MKKEILRYNIMAHDNDSCFFDNATVSTCETCGYYISKDLVIPEHFKLTKKKMDLSYTYDGILIGSERFRQLCLDECYSGIEFIPIPNLLNFYKIISTQVVEYDHVKARIRFIKKCPTCGNYESIVGAHPVLIKDNTIIPSGHFFRTDIAFASGNEKAPLLIGAADIVATMKSKKLRGIDYEAIYAS